MDAEASKVPGGEQGNNEDWTTVGKRTGRALEARVPEDEGLNTGQILEENGQVSRQVDLTKRIMAAANETEQENYEEAGDDWEVQGGRRQKKRQKQ